MSLTTKTLAIVIYLILICTSLFSQEQKSIDSLLHCINSETNDSIKVNLMNELSGIYIINEPEKAKEYANKAIQIAEKFSYTKGATYSYDLLGIIHLFEANYEKSVEYFSKSLEVYKELDLKKNSLGCLNNLGVTYSKLGNYSKAMECYQESLIFAEELNDLSGVSNCLTNIGLIYQYQGNFTKAIEYHQKSLKIDKETGNQKGVSSCLNNIGEIHESNNDLDKAIDYYQKALSINKEITNTRSVSLNLMNIGRIYLKKRKLDEALDYLNKSIKVGKEIDVNSIVTESIGLIGELYLKKGEYKKALLNLNRALKQAISTSEERLIAHFYIKIGELYFEKSQFNKTIDNCLNGLAIAEKNGEKEEVRLATNLLAKSYSKIGNYENAYKFHVIFKETNDSIYNFESKKKIASMEANFELEKKEQEIKLNQAQIEKQGLQISQQKTIQNTIIGGSILLILLFIMVIFLIRSTQHKKVQRIKDEMAELRQKMLAQQLNPHFIFNTLNSIQHFINTNEKEASMEFLGEFAKLMRTALDFSQKEFIVLDEEKEFLNNYLSLEQKRLNKKFSYNIDIPPSKDGQKLCISPFLIQPSVENAIKHGISSKDVGRIDVLFQVENNQLRCTVKDNGTGLNSEIKDINHKSMANSLTHRRLKIMEKLYQKSTSFSINNWSENNESGCIATYNLPLIKTFV